MRIRVAETPFLIQKTLQKYNMKSLHVVELEHSLMKHGGGRVMLWGCAAPSGAGGAEYWQKTIEL